MAFYGLPGDPGGGQQLWALWDKHTWVFGVQGSAQYGAFVNEGFTPQFLICWVWPGST